jgi:hypothetical protein
MSKALITDEVRHEYVADITKGQALETVPIYDYAYVNSSTGSGVAVASSCILHSVLVSNTGASGSFLVLSDLEDTTSAAPTWEADSASTIARIYTGVRGKYVYDILIGNALCYRLSGAHTVSGNPNNDGITILYQLV